MASGHGRRVVVTGLGAVSPLGNSFTDSWLSLLKSNSGMTTFEEALRTHQGLEEASIERELALAKDLTLQVVAPVKDFMKRDSRTPRFVQMALQAGEEAMCQSGLIDWIRDDDLGNKEELQRRRERLGVSIGSGMSGVREISEALDTIASRGYRRLSPHFIPKVLTNSASGRLSLEYGLQGPNIAPSTACAAGSHAIGDAYRCIQYGSADAMLAGGAEASIEPLGLAGFSKLRAMSTAFPPHEASRPFDSDRDGFIMGEGSAVIVLEELNHALSRRAAILAEVVGYGLSGDAFHITAPDVDGRGAERAIRMALDQAEKHDITAIGYVNAHATSTPKGDDIEASVIDNVLNSTSSLFVSSSKGATGHLLGAAGAIEAAFAIQSIVDQTIPPNSNLTSIDGKYRFQLPTERVKVDNLESVMSNSFGFGGTNACLVFKVFTWAGMA